MYRKSSNSFSAGKISVLVSILTLVQAAGFAVPAFAGKFVDTSLASLRQDRRLATQKIEGSLSCTMPETNNGQPCAMKFTDSKTGKTFRVANPDAILRMYHSGVRNVSVEANSIDSETLRIGKANAL